MATKKPATPKDEKFENIDFNLFDAINALDKKDYDYYDNLTEEQQRKFVPFMMVKYLSSVTGHGQANAVLSTEFFANMHIFNEHVMKHPKLQWLMLCAVSPKSTKQFHPWIPQISEKISSLKDKPKVDDIRDYFGKIYPGTSKEVLTEYAEAYVTEHKKKSYLAKVYPNLKLTDIETLCNLVTDEDIKQYEKERGNL